MSTHPGPSVVAVVVTYNRRELLAGTLRSIEAQTIRPARIVLVDNNSDDGTEQMIHGLDLAIELQYERLNKNIGGAGGFKRGMKLAYDVGADWLWCMDDDCSPHGDALEKLLNALEDETIRAAGFLASRVLWTDGTPCLMNLPVAHPMWIGVHGRHPGISRILGSSFVSMLVSRRAMEAVGLPVEEFFIWFDDAEYTRRITATMPAYLVTDSVVTHKTPRNIEPLAFEQLTEASLWKYRFGVRNECSFQFHTYGAATAFLFIDRILRRMSKAGLPFRFRPAVLKACIDGLFFDYPRYIEFPTMPAKAARGEKNDPGQGHAHVEPGKH